MKKIKNEDRRSKIVEDEDETKMMNAYRDINLLKATMEE